MLYESESGDLKLVASGDTMITRRLSVFRESRFSALFDLFRRADVGFTNLEMLMHEFEHAPGVGGGTYTGSDPANLAELSWAGINLVSCANNHNYDYGEGGILTNLKHLRAAGIVHAGTGRNLSEARAPSYLDTPRGRIALISASSTFADPGRALDQRPDMQGRPGLNPLRFSTTHVVDRPALDELRRISGELGFEEEKAFRRAFGFSGAGPEDSDTSLHFKGMRFDLGEQFAVRTAPLKTDLEGNLKWVRDARRMADWVLVSMHCHEFGETREEPPDFLRAFARACIDEGAHAFLGHGPHFDKGIEIYKGRPIIYSMGNFIFQNDTVRWQPSNNYEVFGLDHYATPADFYATRSGDDTRSFAADPVYWESIVVECDYRGGELKKFAIHPIDMGYGRSRAQRGRPLLADAEVGRRILERIQRLSKPLGTTIDISDGVGVVRLG